MNRNALVALTALLTAALACTVPAGTPPTPVVVTRVVVIPPEVSPAAPPTQAASPPTVSFNTATATGTATVTPTATLSGPIATFIMNANCRTGPGSNFDAVTSFLAGQSVEIVGRNPDFTNTWWYVKIPNSHSKCWVSLTTAQAYGDFDTIPTVSP